MNEKRIEVAFIDEKLKASYLELKEGKFEGKQLFDSITKAINELENNPPAGTRVPNNIIPREYIQKYAVDNL